MKGNPFKISSLVYLVPARHYLVLNIVLVYFSLYLYRDDGRGASCTLYPGHRLGDTPRATPLQHPSLRLPPPLISSGALSLGDDRDACCAPTWWPPRCSRCACLPCSPQFWRCRPAPPGCSCPSPRPRHVTRERSSHPLCARRAPRTWSCT